MRAATGLAIGALVVYLASFRTIVTQDTVTNVLLAYSFVLDRDPYLDEFFGGPLGFWSFASQGHLISWYPPGTSLFAAPFAALGLLLGIAPPDTTSVTVIGKLAAASATAASVGIVSLIAARIAGPRRAVAVGTLYAFGTACWPTSGGSLWQHGPGQLLIALGMFWSFPRGEVRPALAGLAFGAAAIVRHANGLLALATLVYLWRRHEVGPATRFLAATFPAVLVLLAYNLVAFGRPTNPFYTPFGLGNILVGITGNLVAPSRGILVYSPFLLFGMIALGRALGRNDELGRWVRWQSAGAIGVLLFHSIYVEWWGGYGYGNRYLAETLPLLSIGLALWLREVRRPRAAAIALAVTGAWSLLLAATGALLYDWPAFSWETVPGVADDARMWSLDHAQWLFTLRNAGPRIDAVAVTATLTAVTVLASAALLARTAPDKVPA